MKRFTLALLIPLAVGAIPAVAAAQDVFRRSYTFLERELSIEVLADAPGVLHVVRGQPGQLAVTARAEGGFPEFALAGHARDRLRLTAAGDGPAEYVVVIPEHVQLHLALPGQHVERMPYAGAARYAWIGAGDTKDPSLAPAAADAAGPAGTPGGAARLLPAAEPALAYTAAVAPRRLHLADLAAVRSLEVRVGGGQFAVAASRPLELRRGAAEQLELRVAGEPLDLVVHVPQGTSEFVLTAGAVTALTVRDGVAQSRCAPLIAQRLAGEQRFTLSPAGGALMCR